MLFFFGEPPTFRGYTPSVFSQLPKLLERCGRLRGSGAITGVYSVLVEGDDMNEPVADAARAILDGHIVLSRELAAEGHYPAIDILHSVSRLTSRLSSPEHIQAMRKVREALAVYEQSKDLILLGAYTPGSNARLDASLRVRPKLIEFLRQDATMNCDLSKTAEGLKQLAAALG